MRGGAASARATGALAGVLAFGVVWTAWAQGGGRVLHEYFESAGGGLGAGATAGASQAPRTAVREPGSPPPLTLNAGDDEPVLGTDGPESALGMDNPQGGLNPQNARNPLDDRTDEVDELNYFSSFDPSVIPYKRVVAQNLLELDGPDGYAFRVDMSQGVMERVRVGGASSGDEFWGTFLVKMKPGELHPIPSVAPDQRLLEVKVAPEQAKAGLEFVKDSADNFYVKGSHRGVVRLNVKLSVERFYFTGEMKRVSWAQMRAASGDLATMPWRARDKASQIAGMLRVDGRSPEVTVRELTRFFRGFKNEALGVREEGTDKYEAIVMAQKGVCRHRSFAFAITANALGIPTRYVYNEAHAFVEVFWPGKGWRRIDLGGSAEDILMRAGERQDHRVHDAVDDALPTPPAYMRELEKLAQKEGERREAARSGDGPQSEDAEGEVSVDPGNEAGEPGGDPFDANPSDGRARATLQMRASGGEVKRGGTLQISGRMGGPSGVSVGGKVVQIVLAPRGARGDEGQVLGEVEVDASGRFSGEVEIPRDIPIGLWSLRAVYGGDDALTPALSD